MSTKQEWFWGGLCELADIKCITNTENQVGYTYVWISWHWNWKWGIVPRLSVVRENMHRDLCGSSTRNPASNMNLQKNKTSNVFVRSASILISALTFNPLNNRQNGLHLQLPAFRHTRRFGLPRSFAKKFVAIYQREISWSSQFWSPTTVVSWSSAAYISWETGGPIPGRTSTHGLKIDVYKVAVLPLQ